MQLHNWSGRTKTATENGILVYLYYLVRLKMPIAHVLPFRLLMKEILRMHPTVASKFASWSQRVRKTAREGVQTCVTDLYTSKTPLTNGCRNDLIDCICRNVSPVYLFIFQLHLLFSLLPCLWWTKIIIINCCKVISYRMLLFATKHTLPGGR